MPQQPDPREQEALLRKTWGLVLNEFEDVMHADAHCIDRLNRMQRWSRQLNPSGFFVDFSRRDKRGLLSLDDDSS
jgi:hypothetical protein